MVPVFAATATWLALAAQPPSDISRDEVVTFFPTVAWRVADDNDWRVEIHGWIYEPEPRTALLALMREALGLAVDPRATSAPASGPASHSATASGPVPASGSAPASHSAAAGSSAPASGPAAVSGSATASGSAAGASAEDVFTRRAHPFVVDNERGQTVPVLIADRTFVPPPSAPNGHFRGVFRIADLDARPGAAWLAVRAVTPPGDPREFAGRVRLVGPVGVCVVSDIDDTVKVSHVRDREELLRNTFLRPMRAVDGMAELYRRWEAAGDVTFHYVSAGPWQLYPALAEFVRDAGLPDGTFHLRPFRIADGALLDLLGQPDGHKTGAIETLLERFPRRTFVLVGDSGERDPEIYAAIAQRHAERIAAIFIRDVTAEPGDSERYRRVFERLPRSLWRVFREPGELGDWVPRP